MKIRFLLDENLNPHWGIFVLVQNQISIGQLADELFLLWEASEAKEWIDQRRWLPM